MITETARAAYAFHTRVAAEHAPAGPRPSMPNYIPNHRSWLTGHVATTLGVPPSYVAVTDDPIRRVDEHPADLVVVADSDAPDDPARWMRFATSPGIGGTALLLLDQCPTCHGELVPVAEIYGLVDLGIYLDRTTGSTGTDAMPEDAPATPETDPTVSARSTSATSDDGTSHDKGTRYAELRLQIMAEMAWVIPMEFDRDPGHRTGCPFFGGPVEATP